MKPVLDAVRNNCIKIEQERDQSADEQMIPAKTKRSGIRQYMPKEIHKWGFKNFVRAGKSGIIYHFFVYAGATSTGAQTCGAEDVILRLVQEMPKHKQFRLYFDNWVSTLSLLRELKTMEILATGTFRINRIGQCPLLNDKELKKQGRGTWDYCVDQNSGTHLVKWFDNKSVTLGSTHAGVGGSAKVKRFDRKKKVYVEITAPDIVLEYNASMGGVDLADMLIELYRTRINTKKRWYLKLIFHCIDISKVNAWLLYRRHCTQLRVPKKKQMSLRSFISHIATALKLKDKDTEKKAGRPKRSLSPTTTIGRKPATAKPIADVRYDGFCHWPEIEEKRGRCRICNLTCSVSCSKCKMRLCLNKDINCFKDFHTR